MLAGTEYRIPSNPGSVYPVGEARRDEARPEASRESCVSRPAHMQHAPPAVAPCITKHAWGGGEMSLRGPASHQLLPMVRQGHTHTTSRRRCGLIATTRYRNLLRCPELLPLAMSMKFPPGLGPDWSGLVYKKGLLRYLCLFHHPSLPPPPPPPPPSRPPRRRPAPPVAAARAVTYRGTLCNAERCATATLFGERESVW